MIKKIISIVLTSVVGLFIIPTIVNAQTGVMTGQKVYGGTGTENFKSIVATSDGGFVAVGESNSSNITPNGNWDAIIVKYDEDGDVEWQKAYGSLNYGIFYSVVATSDGGYVTVGESVPLSNTTNGNIDGIIVKYDEDGDVEWQKIYDGSEHDSFYSVVATSDGGYVAVGYSNSSSIAINGSHYGIIVKYDEDGDVEWQKIYDGSDYDSFYSVVATSDGGYVAVGGSNSTTIAPNGNNDGIIIKYDEDGDVEWQKAYGGSDYDVFNSVGTVSDGGFVAVGYSYSSSIAPNGGGDGIIVKFDEDGDVEWQKAYGGSAYDSFNLVAETSDGEYVAVGGSNSTTIASNGNNDGIIIKYDEDGDVEWQKVYGGSEHDSFNSVAETSGGRYVTVGYSYSPSIATNGNSDGIIVTYINEFNISMAPVTNGTASLSKTTALTGDTITLTINPSTNYRLKSVKILKTSDDSDVTTSVSYNATNKTFTMPSYDVEVNVEFEKIPFTIIANNVTNVTITPNGTINVFTGDNKEIEIIANTGYRLKKVLVDNVEQTLPLTNNKITLTNITKNIVISVEVEEIIYTFDDDSKNKTYTIGTDTELPLKIKDTNIDNFDKVYVNNVLIDEKYFEVKTGSIVVTLKDTYLKTLENGTYNLKVTTKDGGKAITTFIMADSQVGLEENPKTGDGIMNSMLLGAISIIEILGCGLFLNKKKRYN